jgi:hypothetical protein
VSNGISLTICGGKVSTDSSLPFPSTQSPLSLLISVSFRPPDWWNNATGHPAWRSLRYVSDTHPLTPPSPSLPYSSKTAPLTGQPGAWPACEAPATAVTVCPKGQKNSPFCNGNGDCDAAGTGCICKINGAVPPGPVPVAPATAATYTGLLCDKCAVGHYTYPTCENVKPACDAQCTCKRHSSRRPDPTSWVCVGRHLPPHLLRVCVMTSPPPPLPSAPHTHPSPPRTRSRASPTTCCSLTSPRAPHTRSLTQPHTTLHPPAPSPRSFAHLDILPSLPLLNRGSGGNGNMRSAGWGKDVLRYERQRGGESEYGKPACPIQRARPPRQTMQGGKKREEQHIDDGGGGLLACVLVLCVRVKAVGSVCPPPSPPPPGSPFCAAYTTQPHQPQSDSRSLAPPPAPSPPRRTKNAASPP